MLMRIKRDEDGIALITVLLFSLVIMTLLTGISAYALGSLPIAKHDQDWNAALAAAEAGVDDYIFRMNQGDNYWQYSSTNAPPGGNLAFTQYVAVPGPSNSGLFRYKPDVSTVAVNGVIKLTSTGKVGNVTRTVVATIRRRSFLDYLYFTDFETKDPASYVNPPDSFTPTEAQAACAMHYYEGRDSNCVTIYFTSGDQINGPLHTNDAMAVNGTPDFNGNTSTSWNDPAGVGYRGSGTPTFANAGDPAYAPPLTMPPSNTSIKNETNPASGGTGCLYTGPTQIKLSASGTMDVVSPFTKSNNAGCGPGTNLALPPDGVVYVQNVPSIATDPNYTNGCPYAGSYPPGLPVPIVGDLTTYACRDADTFVSGMLRGQLTIASEHDIVIVDNLRYQAGTAASDMLGLVANNYVEVFHPISCTNSNDPSCNLNRKTGGTFTNPVIQAAVLAVQHSFTVQNYKYGSTLGTLNLTGAIAQSYRGPVGTIGGSGLASGYLKNYVYDTRLKYTSSPHFLDPVASAWQVATWAETATPAVFP
jgi:Tfp pilus assembly protein PilX